MKTRQSGNENPESAIVEKPTSRRGHRYRTGAVSMTRTLVVLCTLAAGLTGCATHHEPPAPEQLVDQLKEQDAAQKKAQPVLAARYSDCNRAAAKGVAFQQGDPVSLAVAARGLCARFELELEKAVKNAYGDIIDPSDVNRMIEDAREAMIERNAAEIATYREARASAPPRPKLPQTDDY